MHDHNYTITFLKTPFGYLTRTGFTLDINSKDILLLPSNTYGKYSSMIGRINYFSKFYNLDQEIYEKLEEYIKILAQIVCPKLVIFLNLKAFLEKEEMENLMKICFYNKVTILLIESEERYSLDNEKMFIIDKDRCLVVK